MHRLLLVTVLLIGLPGCLCLPFTDERRPQARVVLDGGGPPTHPNQTFRDVDDAELTAVATTLCADPGALSEP